MREAMSDPGGATESRVISNSSTPELPVFQQFYETFSSLSEFPINGRY